MARTVSGALRPNRSRCQPHHRDKRKRFVVHADEKLTAFVEVESEIRAIVDCA
jgi:hypothetical protein